MHTSRKKRDWEGEVSPRAGPSPVSVTSYKCLKHLPCSCCMDTPILGIKRSPCVVAVFQGSVVTFPVVSGPTVLAGCAGRSSSVMLGFRKLISSDAWGQAEEARWTSDKEAVALWTCGHQQVVTAGRLSPRPSPAASSPRYWGSCCWCT